MCSWSPRGEARIGLIACLINLYTKFKFPFQFAEAGFTSEVVLFPDNGEVLKPVAEMNTLP